MSQEQHQLNSTNGKRTQTTKELLVSNPFQFDLPTAYRLLIGAYIRSTGKTKEDADHEDKPSKQTKSREIHHHEVDLDC